MIVGRLVVVVLVGISLAWIPIVQLSDELFDYIQAVTGYLAPPICATYVLGIFWERTTEIGVFSSLVIGLVIGVTRFAWEISYGSTPCGEVSSNPPHQLITMHYLHFSILLFGISVIIIVCASLMTPPLSRKYTRRLIFADRHAKFIPKLDMPKLTIVSEAEKEAWEEEGEAMKTNPPWWRKAVNWLCGIEAMQDPREPVYTEEEALHLTEQIEQQVSIYESPRDRLFVNIGLGVSIAITVFIWGFFA